MKREAKPMARLKPLGALVFFIEFFLTISPLAWAAEKFISKVPNADGSYCHLKFPAISESTLFSDRPVLKDPSEGDIRDFYVLAIMIPWAKKKSDGSAPTTSANGAGATAATE